MSSNGLHRIRWRRVAVARIHRIAACQFARDLVHIQQSRVEEGIGNIGKRTPSDPMETGCRGKNPSDCRESVRERLANIQQESIGLLQVRWRWRRIAVTRVNSDFFSP